MTKDCDCTHDCECPEKDEQELGMEVFLMENGHQ